MKNKAMLACGALSLVICVVMLLVSIFCGGCAPCGAAPAVAAAQQAGPTDEDMRQSLQDQILSLERQAGALDARIQALSAKLVKRPGKYTLAEYERIAAALGLTDSLMPCAQRSVYLAEIASKK